MGIVENGTTTLLSAANFITYNAQQPFNFNNISLPAGTTLDFYQFATGQPVDIGGGLTGDNHKRPRTLHPWSAWRRRRQPAGLHVAGQAAGNRAARITKMKNTSCTFVVSVRLVLLAIFVAGIFSAIAAGSPATARLCVVGGRRE